MGYGSKEVKGGSWMSKHSLANSRFIKDMPIEHDMHRDGPKNYDTDKGSHAHPHDGPKKYGAMKGDQSATKKDYESGGPGMMSKGPHKEKWERQANRARRANERGNTERGAKLEAKARKNYKN
jgi:hypothetical protein